LIDDKAMDTATLTLHRKDLDQSLRLTSLVSDLLTLSRLESDQGEVQFRPIDLREAVTSHTARRCTSRKAKVEMVARVSDGPIMIEGDGKRCASWSTTS
jgi:K+-sensing histidine kinase KdpD